MNTIDLKKIIDSLGLCKKKVAEELFPSNTFKDSALKRILSGESKLDADQISRFSLFSGVPIAELYSGFKWTSKIGKNSHVLTSGNYRAELCTESWTTKVFKNDSIFHEFVLMPKTISLEDYIKELDKVTSKDKTNSNKQ